MCLMQLQEYIRASVSWYSHDLAVRGDALSTIWATLRRHTNNKGFAGLIVMDRRWNPRKRRHATAKQRVAVYGQRGTDLVHGSR